MSYWYKVIELLDDTFKQSDTIQYAQISTAAFEEILEHINHQYHDVFEELAKYD